MGIPQLEFRQTIQDSYANVWFAYLVLWLGFNAKLNFVIFDLGSDTNHLEVNRN